MRFCIFETRWGSFGFVAIAKTKRLVATFLPTKKGEIRRQIEERYPSATENRSLCPEFQKQVRDYFSGKPTKFRVGTETTNIPPFRQTVLEACRKIPFGKTASYADLARAVGNPAAVRAVGGAMAHNPLPLVIPCHRVLRSDGSIGGFSSWNGTNEKRRMLQLEGIDI